MSGTATAFACFGRPPTWNKTAGRTGRAFLEAVRAAYREAGGGHRDGLLYGAVYWFVRGYSRVHHPDADNISKPIWDTLGKGGAYRDDRQVRLRIAAVVDLSLVAGAEGADVEALDLSDAPPVVASAVETLASGSADGNRAVGVAAGFVYVELGRLRPAMLRFGLAGSDRAAREGDAELRR